MPLERSKPVKRLNYHFAVGNLSLVRRRISPSCGSIYVKRPRFGPCAACTFEMASTAFYSVRWQTCCSNGHTVTDPSVPVAVEPFPSFRGVTEVALVQPEISPYCHC